MSRTKRPTIFNNADVEEIIAREEETVEVTAVIEEPNNPVKETPLADRLPKNISTGQTLYVRLSKNSVLRADRVKAIIIRENNVGILFYSGIEINANEVGNLILFNDK